MIEHLVKSIDYLLFHFLKKDDWVSFSKYYTPTAEIKDFNDLLMAKFFWGSNKHKEETHEKIIEMSKNDYYTTGNLFDYDYF